MKSKKLITMFLIGGMILFNSLSVFADTTSGEVAETATITSGDLPTQEVTVSYVSAESFFLTIPKRINLDGTQTNPETTFNVSCTGDVAGTSYVKVTADESFILKQEGKEDVIADVFNKGFSTEPYFSTIFSSSQIASGKTVEGVVSVPNENGNKLTAGEWKGSFNFYIKWFGLEQIENTENEEKGAGLYGLDGSFTPWDDLFYTVELTGYSSYRVNKDADKLIIPNTVTEIKKIDGYGSHLNEVIIPVSVSKIGEGGFSGLFPKKITYEGTLEQWQSIDKDSEWFNGTISDDMILVCDGVEYNLKEYK